MIPKKWMRGGSGSTWWPAILLGLMLAGLVAGCGARLEKASVRMMDEAEARWQADPVPSYRTIVDMERSDERRRYEVTVQQGQITRGVLMYWDARQRQWDTPYELSEEQAFPFTVPGLFDMVRGELRGSDRADIRVAMREDPPFPQRIVLGPVWQDGRPVSGTETTVIVRQFELLATD